MAGIATTDRQRRRGQGIPKCGRLREPCGRKKRRLASTSRNLVDTSQEVRSTSRGAWQTPGYTRTGPIVLLSTLFPDKANLMSTFNARHQTLHRADVPADELRGPSPLVSSTSLHPYDLTTLRSPAPHRHLLIQNNAAILDRRSIGIAKQHGKACLIVLHIPRCRMEIKTARFEVVQHTGRTARALHPGCQTDDHDACFSHLPAVSAGCDRL